MKKYIFIENKLKFTPYSHSNCISSKDYDITVRLIIFDKEKVVYIRLNDFSPYQGLEYKQVEYKFKQTLLACEAYLRKNYKKYKVYDSYDITNLPDKLQEDILNS